MSELTSLLESIGAAPDQLAHRVAQCRFAVIVFDVRRTIVTANAEAELLFGYPPGGLGGLDTSDLVPVRFRQPQSAPDQVPVTDVVRVELAALTAQGEERATEWSYGALRVAERWLFVMRVRDLGAKHAEELAQRLIVERAAREAAEAAEHRAKASEEQVRRLQQVTAALSEAATPADVARVVLDQSIAALKARGVAFYALDAAATTLELIGQRGHPDEPLAQFSTIAITLHAPLSDAARLRRAVFYESAEACASVYPLLADAIRSGDFEASVALPLITHGTVLGVLGIRFSEARPFDDSERSAMLTLAELSAQALERARLFSAEREARAQAEAASRAKDEFLAMLGHELRNPLAPIVTALTLMEHRDGATGSRERRLIERQVKHLVRLVDDLLDVSGIAQGKVLLHKERLELAVVVARAVELVSPLLEQRQHQLTVRVAGEGLAVEGDMVRLAQVVGNLLGNAAKYTPQGGRLEVWSERDGDSVVLHVKDDGQGISPQMLPRIFDLFVQERQSIERPEGGLGLGLALVKSLTLLHGGTVTGTSDGEGRGSTFTLRLPATSSSPPTQVGPARDDPSAVAAGIRVMVVDDNLDSAEALAELMQILGYEAQCAHDGPSALTLAATFQPQMAVLDIGLPVMDGYELARRLREVMGPALLRLIALTGYGQSSDVQLAREAGFDVHLVKPVQVKTLRKALSPPPDPIDAPVDEPLVAAAPI